MRIHNYDTELEELKDCPFCGGRPIAFMKGNLREAKIEMTIKCKKCNVQKTIGALSKSFQWLEDQIISFWNKRV